MAAVGHRHAGHKAMREALGTADAALRRLHRRVGVVVPAEGGAGEGRRRTGDLTRAGLLTAAKSLTSVDYEGMLPAGSGNYAPVRPER